MDDEGVRWTSKRNFFLPAHKLDLLPAPVYFFVGWALEIKRLGADNNKD